MTCAGLLLSCSSIDKNNPDNPSQEEKASIAAININDETHDADILLLCSNGSYILCDINEDNKCGIFYMNNSIGDEFEDGITMYVDETGTPIMLQSREGDYFFKNVTETSCDIAFQDGKGNISYYWDIQLKEDSLGPSKIRANWSESLTYPFTNWLSSVSSFDWTWDDAQRKAIIPYIAKMASFGITAYSMVRGTPTDRLIGFKSFFEEANKSNLFEGLDVIFAQSIITFLQAVQVNETYKDFLNVVNGGDISFAKEKIGLALLAEMLNAYGDQGLANLAVFEENTEDIYSNKEYQIKLSNYFLECTPEENTYIVDVNTKSFWMIDAPQNGWCNIEKNNNRIIVKVKAYEGTEDRVCTATIHTVSEKIPNATLTIRQRGVVFALSETELTFAGQESSRGVYVTTNQNVRSWKIVSIPDWLTFKEDVGNNSFFLTVNSKRYNGKIQTGEVVVEAYLQNAGPISKTIQVIWLPQNAWDNTRWEFRGNFNILLATVYENENIYYEMNYMYLQINNLANNDYIVSLRYEKYPYPCTLTEDYKHRLLGSVSGMSWWSAINGYTYSLSLNFVITRTSETTAVCEFDYYNESGHQYCTFSGTRIK